METASNMLDMVDRQINDLMQNIEIIIVNIKGKIETEEIILFFPFQYVCPCFLSPSFFLAPRFQEQERPRSSLFGPGVLPGTVSSSLLFFITSQVSPDTNSFLSSSVREEEITNLIRMPSNHLQPEAETQVPGEIHP